MDPRLLDLGLWTFATRLDGSRDYRELVHLGTLGAPVGGVSRRSAISNSLSTIQARPGAATGLYDSILAAYRLVKASYDVNKVNAVLIFTRGENEDPDGMTLDALRTALSAQVDRHRPIPVYIIAVGPDADIRAARKISELTTGTAYRVSTPGEVNDVFLDALGQRQCRPTC